MSWPMVAIGELSLVTNGKTPSKADKRDDGHPVLKIRDVDELGLFRGMGDSFVESKFAAKFRSKWVVRGDTLVLNAAHNADYVGSKSFYASEAAEGMLATGEWLIVRPDESRLDARYAHYWLTSAAAKTEIRDLVKGIHLYPKDVARLKIPLPPLPEQRRIAGILDQADALRRLRRQSLSRLSDLGQAIFYEMFGDPARNPKGFEMRPLRDTASKFSDGPFGSNLKSAHYVEAGVRVIRLQNIGVGEFIDKDKAYISASHFASLKKHECLPGDILVGTLGDPNLRACIQPEWLGQALNKADCVQIRVNLSIANNEYVCALLNTPSVERMAHDLVHGQTRARISMGRLRDLRVPIPPKDQQDRFGEVIAKLKQEVQSSGDAWKQADSLFAALQHRAFRGEL